MKRLYGLIGALIAVILSAAPVLAKVPDGWPFLEFNEAVQTAKRLGKPMFVYFGFETCPYCLYLNQHALASGSLRKLYTGNYTCSPTSTCAATRRTR